MNLSFTLARRTPLVAVFAALTILMPTFGSAQTTPPAIAPRPAPGRLVCVGGSMTAGEAVTPDECYVGRLRARAAAAGVDLRVSSDGRSGWSTGAFAHSLDKVADRVPADATLVTIVLGTNDARSKRPAAEVAAEAAANLAKLVAAYRAKAPGATIVIVAPPTIDVPRLSPRLVRADYGPWSPTEMSAIRVAYRDLAKRLGVRFVDLLDVLAPGQTVDGVHPNAAGHARIADAIWPALMAGAYALPEPSAGKLVCVGASTTAGHLVAAGESYVDRLRARAVTEGVALAVIADGRGGWSTADYLDHADQVVAAVPADATVVTLLLGINDTRWPDATPAMAARSAANVERLVGLYHRRASRARFILLSATAFDPDRTSGPVRRAGYGPQTPARLQAVVDAYRALAGRSGWGFVDLSALPTGGHTVDGLHPDPAGHAQIADAVWAALAAMPFAGGADGPSAK